MSPADQHEEGRLVAAFEFVRRTGAIQVQVRYSDDELPTVFVAVAQYRDGRTEVDAALTPVRAALRLCERLADGGVCMHCGRPSGLDPDSFETLPLNDVICWYQYDPETRRFRRGCEGDTP